MNSAEFEAESRLTQVRNTYEQVARNPYRRLPFHRGPLYARKYLGYSDGDLADLPKLAADRFSGVGNPFALGEVRPGDRVLDLGCGAGADLLIAARRVGPQGRVIGIDASPTMRRCAEMAARSAGLEQRVEIRSGVCDRLPVADEGCDLVIANGVLNLVADKSRLFHEIVRVLKPGGRLHLAALVANREPAFDRENVHGLWEAFAAGACLEQELLELGARVGLRQGKLVGCYDCMRNIPEAETLGRALGLHAVTFFAVK